MCPSVKRIFVISLILRLNKMKIYFFIFLVLSFNVGAITSPITNCMKDEKIIFSCSAKKKIISICAAPIKSSDGYVEYRFSNGGEGKFSYRSDNNYSNKFFYRATVRGSSSSSTMIWFENDGYFYIINDPAKGNASLSVRKENKEIGKTQCKGDFAGDSETLNEIIQEKKSDDYFNLLR